MILKKPVLNPTQSRYVELESGTPKRHFLNNPDYVGPWGDALARAQETIDKGKGVIVGIIGGRGTGKTQISAELIKLSATQERKPIFTTAVEFFTQIKSTYGKDAPENQSDVMDRFFRPNLLVIDELSKRSDSDWENLQLFELINRRYGAMKNTVVTSNQTKDQFDEMFGDSLTSRMNEGGGIIECNWGSFRE